MRSLTLGGTGGRCLVWILTSPELSVIAAGWFLRAGSVGIKVQFSRAVWLLTAAGDDWMGEAADNTSSTCWLVVRGSVGGNWLLVDSDRVLVVGGWLPDVVVTAVVDTLVCITPLCNVAGVSWRRRSDSWCANCCGSKTPRSVCEGSVSVGVHCNGDVAVVRQLMNYSALGLRCENNGTGDLPAPLYCQNSEVNMLATANRGALGCWVTAIDPWTQLTPQYRGYYRHYW